MKAGEFQPETAHDIGVRHTVPRSSRIMNSIIKSLIRLGVHISPITLLTVKGRKTGKLHTTPVGLFEYDGRRFLFSTFGESNWVRNLRKSREAIIRLSRHRRKFAAVELDKEEAAVVLMNAMTPYFRKRLMGRTLRSTYNVTPQSTLTKWKDTAHRHPVFELHRLSD